MTRQSPRRRRALSALIGLICLQISVASSADVFVEADGVRVQLADQASIPDRAEADLEAGTFSVFADVGPNSAESSIAGTLVSLENVSGQSIVLPRGSFVVHVEGEIRIPPNIPSLGRGWSTIDAQLTLTAPGIGTSVASASLSAEIIGAIADPGPNTNIYQHSFVTNDVQGGVSVDGSGFLGFPNGIGEMVVEFTMPAVVIAPNETLQFRLQLTGSATGGAFGGGATTDYLYGGPGATLSLILPTGLQNALEDVTSTVTYNWITNNLFVDVPLDHWAHSFVETLVANGISRGCGSVTFCPGGDVTRAQMAVFLIRGTRDRAFVPPPATGNVFVDVSAGDFAADFIEQLFIDGITAGCGGNRFCPNDPVTRAQMAVFLLRAKYGSDYVPPPAEGLFDDVSPGDPAIDWIEQLLLEGITSGCGGESFCPNDAVTRAQMAVFLVRTFEL